MLYAQADYSWIWNQGLAVGILIAFGYAVYHGLQWTGASIISPLKEAAIAHLATVSKTLTTVSDTMMAIEKKIEKVESQTTKIIDSHEGFFSAAIKDSEEIHRRLDSLEAKSK